ncbi:MAG: tetratricopeptide repeat protein [candidate division WOR-3 bacterium]|nr:MAG: tetratricopeptide repeat protein [candidate division WOR-3 bacterium]
MRTTVHDEISRVESLLNEGKIEEALDLLGMIKSRKGLSKKSRLVCALLEIKIKMKVGKFKDALKLTESVLQSALKQKDVLSAVELYALQVEIAWRSGEFNMGLRALDESERLIKGVQFAQADDKARAFNRRKAELLCNGGIIHWYKGNLNRAIEYHELSLEIMEKLEDLPGMANVFNNLGLVYWSKGDLERSVEYHQRSRTMNEVIGDKRRIGASLNNLGNVYCMKGELDSALDVYQRSLAIKEELGLKWEIATTLINIGSVYHLKGELDLAVDYYRKSLVTSEELANKANIALATNNLGDIFMLRGELGQALECFQKALELYQELGFKQEIALSLSNLGGLYWKKESIEQSLQCYKQSLAMYEEMQNAPYAALVLFNLFWVALEREDSSMAEQYLNNLEQINKNNDNKVIDQRYRVAKALWLKSSKRSRHKLEAVRILEEVTEEKVVDHTLAVTAMIHLCDLLLSELKVTGEEELFGEIKELTSRLLDISKRQSSHLLLTEVYLLQSKLALIELDMGQAKKLLAQAHAIAEEKGLSRLARLIAQERDSLQSQLKKWESLIEQEPSKQKMIDLTNIDALLEQMIQKTITSVIEEKRTSDEEIQTKKYKLVHIDRLMEFQKVEKSRFLVGIAQIGLSKAGNIIHEFYKELAPGLFGFREEIVDPIRAKVQKMVEAASEVGIDLLVFPELTIDLNYVQILEDIVSLAKTHNMFIVPGSYHDHKTKRNLSIVVSPNGVICEQAKHIPANIHFQGTRLTEGIVGLASPQKTLICSTEFGRIAIIICRDFLDMDLRVELKNADPQVDIIINPAFTPVTADFKAAHFDARRSIYAYCFFANVAEFGDSFIYTPERERVDKSIPAREEGLIWKEVDLFKLRSERKKWEIEQAKSRPFIQSTR